MKFKEFFSAAMSPYTQQAQDAFDKGKAEAVWEDIQDSIRTSRATINNMQRGAASHSGNTSIQMMGIIAYTGDRLSQITSMMHDECYRRNDDGTAVGILNARQGRQIADFIKVSGHFVRDCYEQIEDNGSVMSFAQNDMVEHKKLEIQALFELTSCIAPREQIAFQQDLERKNFEFVTCEERDDILNKLGESGYTYCALEG